MNESQPDPAKESARRFKQLLKLGIAAIVFIVVCLLARMVTPATDAEPVIWYSIVPPVLAIVLAFLTRRVLLSLGLAVLVGGLLASVPEAPLSVVAWWGGPKIAVVYRDYAWSAETISYILVYRGYVWSAATEPDNLKILAFIPPIFATVMIVVAAGGFRGIIGWLSRWVKGGKSAQLVTAVAGLLYFFDDYSNTMVVGSAMRPLTDRYRVSREKLAFLVDATSAPIAALALISSWIAYEVGLFAKEAEKLDLSQSGYLMFFDALSFRFYCLFMIVFVFVLILSGRDYGPMKAAEARAAAGETPEDSAEATASDAPGGKGEKQTDRALLALIPLGGLVLFHFSGMWVDGTSALQKASRMALEEGGKALQWGNPLQWTYWREVIGAAENVVLILVYAALFSLALALICAAAFRALSLKGMGRCLWAGVNKSIVPCLILLLAWSLKNACDDLGTDRFLAAIIKDTVPPLWFPALVFIVACLTSFATGTSWGTMAILIPTAIPVAYGLDGDAYGLTTMICLGAVLDGAIFGDHCSPISDTTILSSTSTSCELMRHVRTQLPYSLSVAGLALVCGYIPAALGLAWIWSVGLALSLTVVLIVVLAPKKKP